MILLIAVGSASMFDGMAAMARFALAAPSLDRGDILATAARDPRPALLAAKDETPELDKAAGNWTLGRRAVLANQAGYEPDPTNTERTCVAPDSGAGTTNAISGDRLPQQAPTIETISGVLRASRARAAAESTVDGLCKVRGRLARESGSGEPSLQTVLVGRCISGEVAGRVEQSAGNVLAHSPDGGGASNPKYNPNSEEGGCDRRVHAGVIPCVGKTARRSPEQRRLAA